MPSPTRSPVSLRLAAVIAGLVVSRVVFAQVSPPAGTSATATGSVVDIGPGSSVRLPPEWTASGSNDGFILLPPGVRFDPKGTDNPEVYILAVRDDYDPSEEAQTVKQLSTAVGATGGTGGQRQALTLGTRPGAVIAGWSVIRRPDGKPPWKSTSFPRVARWSC
jgi:hypothetical protein